MNILIKKNTRNIEGASITKRNVLTRILPWKGKDFLFVKGKNYSSKEINSLVDIDYILTTFEEFKDKINFFVFSSNDHIKLNENGFIVNTIESSNILNKYSLNEINKKINNNLINILIYKKTAEVIIKFDGMTIPLKSEVIISALAKTKNKNVFFDKAFSSKIESKGKYEEWLLKDNLKLYNGNNEVNIYDAIKLILKDFPNKADFENFIFHEDKNNGTFYKCNHKVKTTFDKIKEFYTDESNQKKLGIEKIWVNNNEEKITFKTKKYKSTIEKKDNNTFKCSSIILASQFEYSKIKNLIGSNFKKVSIEKKQLKLNRRKSIFSILMTVIFITLMIYTFTGFFTPGEIRASFEVMKNSWGSIWIYILLLATFVKVNTTFFVAWILTKDKKNIRSILLTTFKMSVASSISALVSIITGLDYLGMVFWVWFMSKTSVRSTATIVGAIAVGKLFRSIMSLLIGLPFMIMGSYWIVTGYDSSFADIFSILMIVLVSWLGYLWINMSSAFIFLFAFIKPLNKHFFKIKYWGKTSWTNNGTMYEIYNYKDVLDIRNSMSSFSYKSYQGKRIITLISLSYIILCIQSWSIVNMVLDANYIGYGNYYNFLKIISLKTIIQNFNYSIPIPGDMVSSEWVIRTTFFGFYSDIYAPQGTVTNEVSNLIDLSSTETSFLARFWTFYLPQVYRTIYAIIGIIVLLLVNKKNGATQK